MVEKFTTGYEKGISVTVENKQLFIFIGSEKVELVMGIKNEDGSVTQANMVVPKEQWNSVAGTCLVMAKGD
jgi:hypothetical protein